MNQTKLNRLLGDTIKQGDTSSVFRYKLETNLKDKLNGACKVELINSNKEIYQLNTTVNNNVVEFTIPDVLPIGVYVVEIECNGYVFPSVNNQAITITENVGGTGEVVKLARYTETQFEIVDLVNVYNIAKI